MTSLFRCNIAVKSNGFAVSTCSHDYDFIWNNHHAVSFKFRTFDCWRSNWSRKNYWYIIVGGKTYGGGKETRLIMGFDNGISQAEVIFKWHCSNISILSCLVGIVVALMLLIHVLLHRCYICHIVLPKTRLCAFLNFYKV